mmetsp:Transcript_10323/g.28071  ORF Transcript_10323/g.28071 Transcript_10323/m.28071 type:complete len:274 (-) Transcript_10323:4014-4835(-)
MCLTRSPPRRVLTTRPTVPGQSCLPVRRGREKRRAPGSSPPRPESRFAIYVSRPLPANGTGRARKSSRKPWRLSIRGSRAAPSSSSTSSTPWLQRVEMICMRRREGCLACCCASWTGSTRTNGPWWLVPPTRPVIWTRRSALASRPTLNLGCRMSSVAWRYSSSTPKICQTRISSSWQRPRPASAVAICVMSRGLPSATGPPRSSRELCTKDLHPDCRFICRPSGQGASRGLSGTPIRLHPTKARGQRPDRWSSSRVPTNGPLSPSEKTSNLS